ncbi:MAG: hypothetical protein PHO92_00100 [Candidatus Peribacteraceae bacterium]|nr:hypothetical protein [Candidatus Peribacteraceae bacterium]
MKSVGKQWPYVLSLGILLLLAVQSCIEKELPKATPPPPQAPCKGEPITVGYTFPHPSDASFDNPWECKVQCEDKVQRYIYYTNGVATQCASLPSCLDWGEDNLITCTPDLQKHKSSP